MKVFFDLEFNERDSNNQPCDITVLSLGAVAENGRKFYQVFDPKDADINPWVRENVIPNLNIEEGEVDNQYPNYALPKHLATLKFDAWLRDLGADIQFVGYYCAYDWVLLCRLYGSMMDLPQYIKMNPIDLKGFVDFMGLRYEFEDVPGHNALRDAEGIMRDYKKLWGRVGTV